MATRIVDLDLTGPAPADVPLEGYPRLWAIGWRRGVPVGAALLAASPGQACIPGAAVAEALRAVDAGEDLAGAPSSTLLPPVSVVICTRDRPDRLPVALRALRAQTHADFELVVVDNTRGDPRVRAVLAAEFPDARYRVEPVPGLPRARNCGLRAASGRVVAFTDDDCRPAPRWVETIAAAFAGPEPPGCVTGPILPLELETPAQEAMEARGGFNRGFRRRRHRPTVEEGRVYPVQAWRFGAGGSMAFARECLERLGGFDEALSRSEDLDAFYRVLRAGFDLSFEPGAAVRHRHLPSWDQLARRLFHWGWGYLTYLDKIARSDSPEYAARARLERRNWLRYQLSRRLAPAVAGRADLPLPLVAMELAGGIVGARGYGIAKAASAHRLARSIADRPRPRPGLRT